MIKSIHPCLWFNGQAKEAAEFYYSVFKDSKITADTPMVVKFELNGAEFMALNGGPQFIFNESVSFVVECETQEEIDTYWGKLTAGGQEINCGWLKDKYGLAWQIVPTVLGKLMTDPERAPRVFKAFQHMKNLI
jgi:predicted 3-demethylubiquinone-9 3-methyltransferase (glyoxalase superfamily)